jgi:hypothetical protein
VPLLKIENNMFDFEVNHEFQIAAGTIYQGPVQRPPGTPANMGDLPSTPVNIYSYGVNLYSHANLIFNLNIHDIYSCSIVLNGILADFSPVLATLIFNRIDSNVFGQGGAPPVAHAYFNVERELYVGWLRTVVS